MTPAPTDMVMWECNQRQTVLLPREQVDWLFEVADLNDRIPVAWPTSRGFIFVLMPTPTIFQASRKGGLPRA